MRRITFRQKAADHREKPMRITKRGLQLGLGVLWLLDGALQLQPVR